MTEFRRNLIDMPLGKNACFWWCFEFVLGGAECRLQETCFCVQYECGFLLLLNNLPECLGLVDIYLRLGGKRWRERLMHYFSMNNILNCARFGRSVFLLSAPPTVPVLLFLKSCCDVCLGWRCSGRRSGLAEPLTCR